MIAALYRARRWLCWIGVHAWDLPGGHCQDCGACDEFFGPHEHEDPEGER
jgi:hypothetical protein